MNKLSSMISVACLVLSATATPIAVFAQTATAPAETAKEAMPAKDMAEAEVRKVDKEAKKITLKHGPIKNLDMPSMTMVFQVRDTALIEKIAAGDKIMFTAEQLQGAFVMTSVEKLPPK